MRPNLRQHEDAASVIQPHLKLPILTTHKVLSKQLLTHAQQRLTTHRDRARVNRIHAVGPKPVTIFREPHLAASRLQQSILRKPTLPIRLAFKKVLAVGNYDLGFRKSRKHFELSIEFPR